MDSRQDVGGCFNAAKEYLAQEWSVFPVGWDKKKKSWKNPLVRWKRYQTKLPTANELIAWWQKWPDARVGIITGRVSNLVIVDIDPRHGGSTDNICLPPTLVAKTGGGGWHYYYSHPGDQIIKSVAGIPSKGIDIRADGGYVVAPPSRHVSGSQYEWLEEFNALLIVPCPDWIMKRNQSNSGTPPDCRPNILTVRRSYDPLHKAINRPIEDVIRHVAKMINMNVSFQQNQNSTRQIVENGRITSGFISSQGNYCHSASSKPRRGNPISVAEYYLNFVGGNNYSRSKIIQIINSIKKYE